MNTEQLIDRVIRSTHNTDIDRFYIIDLLNDALTQLTDSAKIEASHTYTLQAGVGEYDLPEDFKSPITLIEGEPSNPSIVYHLSNLSEVKWGYTVYEGKLIVKPVPQAGKKVTLYFYKYASPLKEPDDIPDIDPQWHYLLTIYASAMIMMVVSPNIADRLFANWEDGKRRFEQSMARNRKRSSVNQKVWG